MGKTIANFAIQEMDEDKEDHDGNSENDNDGFRLQMDNFNQTGEQFH